MKKLLGKEYFWIILLSLLVIPFIAISFFDHPSADDYIISAVVRDHGILAHYRQVYFEWSGRYFSTLLECFNPLVYGWFFGYKLIPILLIVLFYIGLFRLFKSIFGKELSSIKIHLISLILLLLYFNNIPSTAESIYWMDGSLEYFTGIILTLFFFALLIKQWNSESIKTSSFLFLIVLVVMIVGTNEISMLLLDEILFIIVMKEIFQKRKLRKCLIISIITAIAATIFEITAPGNYSRMVSFQGNSDFVFTIQQSGISFLKIAGSFIKDPGLLISSLIFVAFLPLLNGSRIFNELTKGNPFITIPLSILSLIGLYIPAVYATGLNPALRVHNIVAFAFIFAFFFNIAVLHAYLMRKNRITLIDIPSYLIKILAVAAFILTISEFSKEPGKEIISEGNIFRAYYDLFISAPTYNQELNDRECYLAKLNAMIKGCIEVKPLSSIPKTIHFVDITKDATNWVNQCEVKYFGIDSVKIMKNALIPDK
ncbi:MAG: DUF6056 family protein [Bacteroidales bacterium]|jgi:hypothetical protein